MFKRALIAVAASLFAQAPTNYHRAIIKPSIVRLAPGAQQQFKTVILATRLMATQAPKSVKWTVNDIPGGNAQVGTIDANELYRAPTTVPAPNEVSVRGEVEGSANRYVWSIVGTSFATSGCRPRSIPKAGPSWTPTGRSIYSLFKSRTKAGVEILKQK